MRNPASIITRALISTAKASNNISLLVVEIISFAIKKSIEIPLRFLSKIFNAMLNVIRYMKYSVIFVHSIIENTIRIIITLLIYLSLISSPIVVALFPFDNPLLLGNKFRLLLLSVKSLSIVVTSILSFFIIKAIYQEVANPTSIQNDGNKSILSFIINFISKLTAWAVIIFTTIFVAIARIDTARIFIDYRFIDFLRDQNLEQAKMNSNNHINESNNKSQAEPLHKKNDIYRSFVNQEVKWHGGPRRQLDINIEFSIINIYDGINIELRKICGSYEYQQFPTLENFGTLSNVSLMVTSHRNCITCENTYSTQQINVLHTLGGKFFFTENRARVLIPKDIISKSEKLSIQIIINNKYKFPFMQTINYIKN